MIWFFLFIFDLIRSEIMPQQRPFTFMEEEDVFLKFRYLAHKYG